MAVGEIEDEQAGARHFAGTCTRMVLANIVAKAGEDGVAEVLRLAGETRSVDELNDESNWSSYRQFRALMEATATVLGSQRCFDDIYDHSGLFDTTMPGAAEMLQALGSPSALHRATGESNGLMKVVSSVGLVHEIGPNESVLGGRFEDGFEPFPEFCSFLMGLTGCSVKLFGLRITLIEDSACVFRGDDHCAVRVRWADADDDTEADRLRLQLALMERRLDAFRDTVNDLVSDEDLGTILQRTVTSAAGAMRAPGFVLALEPLPWSTARVFSHGLDDCAAAEYADALLGPQPGPEATTDFAAVVEVASTKRRYGYLAAIDPHDNVAGYDTPFLASYARLAASTLDSATALEESRRQAASARALLELSAALSEVTSMEQMTANVARTMPIIVDCDAAAVMLFDGEVGRIQATHGYTRAEDAQLRAQEYVREENAGASVRLYTRERVDARTRASMEATGMQAGAAISIRIDGEVAGWVLVGVRTDPGRLVDNPEIEEQLRGLAGQASVALRNARLHDQIRHQALHDGLTGLPNRTLVIDRTEHLLRRAVRQHTVVTALFIDLDGFKNVNDTLGHAAGDELLQAVAHRLHSSLRDTDTIARLGGDEFIVLTETSASDVGPELIAQRIIDVVDEPFQLEGWSEPLRIGASVGIASGARETAGDLFRDADVALYEAKAAGKGRYVTFSPEMHTAVADRVTLETELRGATTRGELFLLYQPIFNLRDERTTGAEALLRWRHPERGVVLPDDFVPSLEETGLIREVGRWVLLEACRQTAQWHAQGFPIDISVNVSARQLEHDSLIDEVTAALTASGLPATSLIVEVTETAIMQDTEATIERLRKIRTLGVRVAIDDFGTGHSSLAYLQRFPVDTLKIDRSFVQRITESPESDALTSMLVQLGKTLGLGTLAEGIEDRDQFAQLQRDQCDSGQGYLFARPLEAEALSDFLATGRARLATPDAPIGVRG